MVEMELVLKAQCGVCRTTKDLYGSQCKHMTLCVSCAKAMAMSPHNNKCYECGEPLSRLIREYNVRPCTTTDKKYFIGRFVSGLPKFSKKPKAENKWSLQKERLKGRHVTPPSREKYKNTPWMLEDKTGQMQYRGHLEGQSATYYLLMPQGKDYVAIPAGPWYNFNKVAQYKQLTIEEAEEKMKNRRKTVDGYERWMMKAANSGAAAFGEVKRSDDGESNTDGGRGRDRKSSGDEADGNGSDNGEEDEDEEASGKRSVPGHKKRRGDDDDNDEGPRDGDLDFDDDDIEKGDDWEHEEVFTDDDDDPEGREDFAPEISPPEIKQDEVDEDENYEDEDGLSNSGKELKKLLGRTNGLNESDDDDDDDDDDDVEDETVLSPVLAPKVKREEPINNNTTVKPSSASMSGTPTNSKSSKGKRKTNTDDAKASPGGAPLKKVKRENDVKPSKDELASSASGIPSEATQISSSRTASFSSTAPVTEDEIRAVLQQNVPMTTQDLVGKFKSRLRTKEEKDAFAAILNLIARVQKTNGRASFIVLRDK